MYNRDLWVPPFLRSLHTIKTTTMCVCEDFGGGGLLAVITVQIAVRLWQMNMEKNSTTELWLPIQRGFTFQSANRRDYSGTRRCKKKGPLTFIHSLLAADTVQAAAVNELKWTGSTTSYTQAWMRWRGQCLMERHISKSIRSFFLSSSDENYCRVLPDD